MCGALVRPHPPASRTLTHVSRVIPTAAPLAAPPRVSYRHPLVVCSGGVSATWGRGGGWLTTGVLWQESAGGFPCGVLRTCISGRGKCSSEEFVITGSAVHCNSGGRGAL